MKTSEVRAERLMMENKEPSPESVNANESDSLIVYERLAASKVSSRNLPKSKETNKQRTRSSFQNSSVSTVPLGMKTTREWKPENGLPPNLA
jgi:hypothetical protein